MSQLHIDNLGETLGGGSKQALYDDGEEVFHLEGINLKIESLSKTTINDLDLEGQHKYQEFVVLKFFNDSLRFSAELPVEIAGEIADRIKEKAGL